MNKIAVSIKYNKNETHNIYASARTIDATHGRI